MRKEIILVSLTLIVSYLLFSMVLTPKTTIRTCDLVKEHDIFMTAKVTEYECYVPENAMCSIKDTRVGNSIRCFTTELPK